MMVKEQEKTYELNLCRGMEGRCSFGLTNGARLGKEIGQLLGDSAAMQGYKAAGDGVLPHKRVKIALAACPNACTQPQIKDIGIIARLFPTEIGTDCNGCSQCEDVCQEQAIIVRDGRALILAERCVGCGLCINECRQKAIESDGLGFQILIGGRMGRRPKWAEELCVVDCNEVHKIIKSLFNKVISLLCPGERMSELVERISLERLRVDILASRIQNKIIDEN